MIVTSKGHLAPRGRGSEGCRGVGRDEAIARRFPSAWLAPVILFALAFPAHAAIELPLLFSDGAVLQRDKPLPIWGRATPGARVEVELGDHRAEATASDSGEWRVELPAQAAGGPWELRIREDGGEAAVVRDLLVGDVWLASGQSNMEWPLSQIADGEAEIARATDPMIRHFKVPRSWSGEPEWQLAGGEWVASSPQVAGDFSAVGHLFAREMREATGVAIGIIDSSWGGSRIEPWMDAATLGLSTGDLAVQARELREADERLLAQTRRNLSRWQTPADDSGWQAADLDASDWAEITVPGLWESAGWAGMDGVAWYRARFTLSAVEARQGVVIGLGRIDDSDTTWVNGRQVGRTEMQYNTPRVYPVPPSALRAGVNEVAVRVEDVGGGGGIHGPEDEVFIELADDSRRSFEGEWKFRPAQASLALVDDKNQHPTLLYNAMIHPLQPYGLRGVIWYQGESNAGTVDDATRYRELFPALIGQWRTQWNAPELPFLWVQLANWVSGGDRRDAEGVVTASPWAVLRESQSATLALPATAEAVSIDIGDPLDIHPANKQDVAHRLALGARHLVLGESLVYAGPVYHDLSVDGERAVLTFDLQGSTLAVRGGSDALWGFEIAGVDGRYHPAQARIVDDTVVVTADAVPEPVAVRYAWSDNPEAANLVNGEGLPASPFRTGE